VVLLDLNSHVDGRGSVTEVYRRSWLGTSRDVLQANLSVSAAGVLRGLHFHEDQSDYWCPVSGTVFIGLYDLRRGSPTEGRKAEIRIATDLGHGGLFIPPGVAHGFFAETDVRLLYFVDAYYSGRDEFGLAWNDPDVGINWPVEKPVLSERDQSNPRLQDLPSTPAFVS
jgi:dTDP-4-dehydrorhamnose 3,5-epimerase